MLPVLRDLQLIEPELLMLHEAHEDERLAGLVSRIREEGVQRNPAIASPYEGGYLVLDGVHRVKAISELGYPLVLVQVVELPTTVESWAHLVEGDIEGRLGSGEGYEIVGERPRGGCLAEVELPRERRVYVRTRSSGLEAAVSALWELQGLYGGGRVRRLDPGVRVDPLEGAVFRYRRFTPGELVEVVRMGGVLPAGLTRFAIRERVLGVRFPLEGLKGETREANAALQEFVRGSWEAGRVRYYPEPVVLFE